jgi:hypothetical protein
MRSRRVIVRLAPYVMTFGLLGSTLAWQSLGSQRVGEDLGTPRVVVDQVAVPTVRTDVPVEPAPGASGGTRSAQGQGGAEAEADGSSPEPSAQAPVVIAELTPHKVDPFALVGVTWASGVPLSAKISVRWRGKQGWSDWTSLDQENSTPEEGRPGTEPQWVQWADAVAVRVTSPIRVVPKDLRIATVDPGDVRGVTPAAVGQPGIILRSAWHARAQTGCSSPIYGASTQAAVIHHTVGSNSYSKAESPGIVRSIQAYHMQANNWCDIGYNFLVDRFGQIFEGRAGGIARPVRAAHSGNAKVNELTMGVSLMGTFTNTAPTSAMKAAAARLVAWRFSIGHIPAKGKVSIGGRTLERIAGHRDVVSTACPGQYAYVWLGASGGLRDTVANILSTVGGSGGSTPVTQSITRFHAVVRGSSVVDFGWDPVRGATAYQLVISHSRKFTNPTKMIVSSNETRVRRLAAGTGYYARVGALRGRSALTNYSVTVGVITAPPSGTAGIPKGLRFAGRTASQLTFAWKATPKATVYKIRLSRSASMASSSTLTVKTTRATFNGLSRSTTYYAQVRAFNAKGARMGNWSGRLSARTLTGG